MTANTLASGRAAPSDPHTSRAAMALKPTMLPMMIAFRDADGSAFRASQFRTDRGDNRISAATARRATGPAAHEPARFTPPQDDQIQDVNSVMSKTCDPCHQGN